MSVYSILYDRALRPLYDAARGRSGYRLLADAKRRQWLTPSEVREFQWAELQRLLHHAYEFSPWYRARFDQARIRPADIRQPDDLLQIPPLTRDEIREHRDVMHATNYRGRTYEHKTGGSSGKPVQFFVNRNSYEWRVAVSMRAYEWAGCEEGKRQFFLWGAPVGPQSLRQRVKARMYNAVLRRYIVNSFRFNPATMADCVRRLNAFRPTTVVGYTNALSTLARYLLDRGEQVAPPHAVITAAEGVNDQQRALIEKAFGAPVFASYGCREFMLIAMECERHNGLHLSSDNLYVEVISGDRPTPVGQVGEILVTDLHNFGMPFLRYKIGDLGVPTDRVCGCGRGLPLLERVEGRIIDVIRTPDGRAVPGVFFPHVFKEFPAVKQFQVVQKQLDRLHIKLVVPNGDPTEQLRQAEREIRNILGDTITIDFERVDEIPLSASGKFRVTVSEL
jgi:phenylacetate-CoA ligase